MNAPHPAEHFTLAEGEKKSIPSLPLPLADNQPLPATSRATPLSTHTALSVCRAVCRVQYEVDTRLDNAGTFTILKEDHTLGNILRMSLLSDKRVLFAGYRMPHPLEPRLIVKVRTRDNTEPVSVMLDSIDNLQVELRTLEDGFKRQLHEHQQLRSTDMDLL